MTLIRLTETGPGVTVGLADEQVRLLAASGVVDIAPGPAARQWRLRGRGTVGAARIGDVELRVEPKVPVARLLFLLGYARDPRFWRDEPVLLAAEAELVPAFAGALRRQMSRALAAGVLHGYRSVDEASPVLRGRLRETDQIGRHLGQPMPLEIRHDEFTVDIAGNRILATAAYRMLRVPGIDDQSRRILRHLLGNLTGVTLLAPGASPPAWVPSRLNARYHTAVRLAELVLAATSVEVTVGEVAANGLLINMPSLFEDFLTTAVRDSVARRHGGMIRGQHQLWLDRAGRHRMAVDIAWVAGGRVKAVIDAKYKTYKPIDDLYQMLAYCTVLGLPHGHLVYAAGIPETHQLRNSEVELTCHAIDLDLTPNVLLNQVDRLVDEIVTTGIPTVRVA